MPSSCNTTSFQCTKKSVIVHEGLFIAFNHGFPLSPKFVINFLFCRLSCYFNVRVDSFTTYVYLPVGIVYCF